MQTMWIDPSPLNATRLPKAVFRNLMNSNSDISPEAIGNSRCLIEPKPLTLPSIGTL